MKMEQAFEEQLRVAIGTAIIQSGYLDQEEDGTEIELLQWHRCPNCPMGEQTPCACSGVPFLSDVVWDRIDMYGDFTTAVSVLRTAKMRRLLDTLYFAWTVISNVDEGNWSHQSDAWQSAAKRWRDEYFRHPVVREIPEQVAVQSAVNDRRRNKALNGKTLELDMKAVWAINGEVKK